MAFSPLLNHLLLNLVFSLGFLNHASGFVAQKLVSIVTPASSLVEPCDIGHGTGFLVPASSKVIHH